MSLYQRLEIIRVTAKRLSRARLSNPRASIRESNEHNAKCLLWRECWLEAAYVQRRIERGEL